MIRCLAWFRRLCRREFLMAGFAGILLSIAAADATALERADQVGKPELSGMRLTVTAVKRLPNGAVQITAAFQRIGRMNWALGPTEIVNIYYWAGGKTRPLSSAFAYQQISIDQRFILGMLRRGNFVINVRIPSGMKSLSVRLGASGLETTPHAIP